MKAVACLIAIAAAVAMTTASVVTDDASMDVVSAASQRLGLDAADVTELHARSLLEAHAELAGAAAAEEPVHTLATDAAASVSASGTSTVAAAAAAAAKPVLSKRSSASSAAPASADPGLFAHPSSSAVRRMDLGKIRNAVVQILCAHSGFNWRAPWQAASEQEVSGTGFFIEIDGQSYILTNAHVVKEAVKVRVRVPDIGLDKFAADVFGICYEKDIALLRLRPKAFANLERLRKRNGAGGNGGGIDHLVLGDSDTFAQGSVAVAVGYPLGQANLKFSTGILSGYEHVSDRLYLQITAPINPGNSGGPLMSVNGLVMGVNTAAYEKASNVGYALPASHIRALLNDFVKSGSRFVTPNPLSTALARELRTTAAVIRSFPYLGANFAPATVELCRYLGYDGDGGVFVRKVAPRGVLHDAGLQPRDLLIAFNGHKLDRFGKTFRSGKAKGAFAERLTVYDLAERIEIGSTITLRVWRNKNEVELTANFAHRSEHEYSVPKIVEPVRQRVSYIVVGGVVFMDLALNHIELLAETNPALINMFRGRHRVAPRVVVSAVLPESTLPEDSVAPGELVTRVNGHEVATLAELQSELDVALGKAGSAGGAASDNWFTVETSENSMVVFDLTKAETRHGSARYTVGQRFKKGSAGVGADDENGSRRRRRGRGRGKGKRHGKGKGHGKGKRRRGHGKGRRGHPIKHAAVAVL